MTRTPLTHTDATTAWLAAHADWAAGLPGEVAGVTTQTTGAQLRAPKQGKKYTAGRGPANTTPWWRDGHSTVTGAGAPLGQIITGLSTDGAGQQPTRGANTEYVTPKHCFYTDETIGAFVTQPVYPTIEAYTTLAPMPARLAAAETRALRPTTAVFGQSVRTFFLMKNAQNHRRSDGLRASQCWQLMDQDQGYEDTSIEDQDTTVTTLRQIYTQLSSRQIMVAELIISGRTQSDAASIMGITQQTYSQIVQQIRRRLVTR